MSFSCLTALARFILDFPFEVTYFRSGLYKILLESRFDLETKIIQLCGGSIRSSTMLNSSGESVYTSLPCFWCSRKIIQFFSVYMMSVVGCSLPCWGSSLIPSLLSTFYQILCLHLLKWSCGFCSLVNLGSTERLVGTTIKTCDPPREKSKEDTSQLFWTISIIGRIKDQGL